MIRWLQITSGRGPAECSWVTYQTVKEIIKEAEKYKIKAEILEITTDTYPNTFKSALLVLEGKITDTFLNSWEGTIQWIGQSTFRPKHKRKNWFIGVSIFKPVENLNFSEKDIKVETMKASGPGGQHVNTTNSAVRITHIPSKLTAIAQEERSQSLNRKLALTRLFNLLEENKNKENKELQQSRWNKHNELERGNPIRIYKGPKFDLQ